MGNGAISSEVPVVVVLEIPRGIAHDIDIAVDIAVDGRLAYE